MYTDPKIQESIRLVEAHREENAKLDPRRMTAEEKDVLLRTFHPDYRENQFTTLRIGPSKGSKVPLELAALLEGKPRIEEKLPDLTNPDYDADVLIGGGGAGCSAAIEAQKAGAKVLLVTKLRMGDANTMMAEGGHGFISHIFIKMNRRQRGIQAYETKFLCDFIFQLLHDTAAAPLSL